MGHFGYAVLFDLFIAFNISTNKTVNCTNHVIPKRAHSPPALINASQPSSALFYSTSYPTSKKHQSSQPPRNPFPNHLTYFCHIFPILHPFSMAVLSLSDDWLSPHPLFSKAESCSYNILKLINFSRPPFPMCFLKHIKNISQGPLYSSPQGKP